MNNQQADPRILAQRIAVICERTRINVSTEVAAHNDVTRALEAAGFEVRREIRLSARDRIDVMVAGVGIEVKIKGSRRDIYRQLERYAESPEVTALVLATSAAWPSGIKQIGGKPFLHASLVQGWL